MQVRSLAPQWVKDLVVAVSCSVGLRCGSDPALPWLWLWGAAAAPVPTPSLGTSICHRCGPKKQKIKKKQQQETVCTSTLYLNWLLNSCIYGTYSSLCKSCCLIYFRLFIFAFVSFSKGDRSKKHC